MNNTSQQEIALPDYTLKTVLRVCLWLFITTTGLLAFIIYDPDILSPLIKTGLPLDQISGLPILGNAIRTAESPQISVQELKELIDTKATNFVLVDVRTPAEYQLAHIPGAILVPLTDIENGTGIAKIKSLVHGHRLITYCSTGFRSHQTLAILRRMGIQGTNLTGGIQAWRQEIDPNDRI